ncbi:radical SAM protein [candidate division WOR-3 bacterium]|nr:radical SAM protein [candidate division WOR-3 bacterium]
MNILMLNPPFSGMKGRFSREQRSPAITKSGTLYYPMWLAYATGVLEKEGFSVKLVDAPANGLEINDVIEIVKDFKPSLIVIDTSTPSIYNDIKIAEKLKDIQLTTHNSQLTTVLVGPHVSATADETLKLSSQIDIVCKGEYDYTIREIARKIKNHPALMHKCGVDNIKGISWQKDGKIIHNPDRPFIENLDEIPFVSKVYKKHLDYTKYFYAHSQYPIVTVVGGRGCPHKCVYCVYPQTFSGRKLRYRSIKNVVDEMEYITKEFKGVREIMFEDDTLTVNRARCKEFCKELLSKNLKIRWSCNSRADVDFETLKLMNLAGCRLFCVGFESGNQQILDNMKKGIKLETMRQFVKDTKKVGILIHGCFLVGNPGETKETMAQTLKFAKELNPDTAQFFPIMVYPGTELYKWTKEKNYLATEDYSKWLTPEGLHNCVVNLPNLSSKEMVEFCARARKEFYMRPSYITKKLSQALKNPMEGKRISKSFIVFAKHLIQGSKKRKTKR